MQWLSEGKLSYNSVLFEVTGKTVWGFSYRSFKAENSLTLKDDFFACFLQGLHSLVVRGLTQVVTVDGQNGITDVKRLRLVGSQALENLRDEDGHLVLFPTCWRKGKETDHLHLVIQMYQTDEGGQLQLSLLINFQFPSSISSPAFLPLSPHPAVGFHIPWKLSAWLSASSRDSGLEDGEELPLSWLHVMNCKCILNRLLISLRSHSHIFQWSPQSGTWPRSRGEAHARLVNMLFESV